MLPLPLLLLPEGLDWRLKIRNKDDCSCVTPGVFFCCFFLRKNVPKVLVLEFDLRLDSDILAGSTYMANGSYPLSMILPMLELAKRALCCFRQMSKVVKSQKNVLKEHLVRMQSIKEC